MGNNAVLDLRNPKWFRAGAINAEVNHPRLGWVPITLIEGDEETLAVYMDAVEMIGPYPEDGPAIPPDSQLLAGARARASMGKPELLFGLARTLNLISDEEAKAAVKTGEVPSVFSPLLAALPEDERFKLELKWAGDAEISRMNPAIVLMASSLYGEQADQVLDSLFGVKV